MIDCAEYYHDDDVKPPHFELGTKTWKLSSDGNPQFENPELLICDYKMPGFFLNLKLWAHFDNLKDPNIDFNAGPFPNLVLSTEKKRMILSIIELQQDKALCFR